MHSPVSDEVRRLLGTALQRPIIDENTSRSTEPAWDSLKHLEFVFLLEEHFGVQLTEDEISNITNLPQVVQLVEARRAA